MCPKSHSQTIAVRDMNSVPSTPREFSVMLHHETDISTNTGSNRWCFEGGREMFIFPKWHDLDYDLENPNRAKVESPSPSSCVSHFPGIPLKMLPFCSPTCLPLVEPASPWRLLTNLCPRVSFTQSNKHVSAHQHPVLLGKWGRKS